MIGKGLHGKSNGQAMPAVPIPNMSLFIRRYMCRVDPSTSRMLIASGIGFIAIDYVEDIILDE